MNIGEWGLGIRGVTQKNRTLDWRQLLSLKSKVRKLCHSVYCHESLCAFLAASFFTDLGSRL